MVDLPGEKLFIKLIDTFGAGFGAFFRSWMIPRDGRAEAHVDRYKKLLSAQTRKDVDRITAGEAEFQNGQLVLIPQEPANDSLLDVYKLADDLSHSQRVEQTLALLQIAQFAQDEAAQQGDEAVSDEPVDPDWFARWRTAAQDVRSEDMQRLWARILVGETKQPGSFSLRTLALLAQLTKKEAEIISRVAPFVIDAWIYNNSLNIPKQSVEDIIALQEIGIIYGGNNLYKEIKTTTTQKFSIAIIYFSKALVIGHQDATRMLRIDIFKVTQVGKEIFSLGKFKPDYNYLHKIGLDIKRRGFDVKIGDIIEKLDEQVRLENITELN